MAAPATRANRRRALGPRDANIFPALKHDDGGPRKRGVCSKQPGDGRISKAARYSGRRVEGRGLSADPLENDGNDVNQFVRSIIPRRDGVDDLDGEMRIQDIQEDSQEEAANSGAAEDELQQPAKSLDTHDSHGPPPASYAAATTLRLRLRMALFKVQTNQTAVPISHLQLPQLSPQLVSVFPPSLVRVSTPAEPQDLDHEVGDDDDGGDGKDGGDDGGGSNNWYDSNNWNDSNNWDDRDSWDDECASPPPSSPPVLTGAICYTSRGIPFPTPMRSSSPSPSYGKPLDIGSSSAYGTSSFRYSSS